MEVDQSERQHFSIAFPNNSINVLCSTSNSGKSYLVRQILKNRHAFFEGQVRRAVIVLCNTNLSGEIYEDLADDDFEVEFVSLGDYDPENLQREDVVVFEDIQYLTPAVVQTINVYTHHSDLKSCFLVTQSLLSNKPLWVLTSIVHRIIIFARNKANISLIKFISRYYFHDQEEKDYLRQIINYSEKNNNSLLIELNQIVGRNKSFIFAISGLDNFLGGEKMSVYFPKLYDQHLYQDNEDIQSNEAEIEGIDPATLPANTYVLVAVKNVRKKVAAAVAGKEEDCETVWRRAKDLIFENIERSMKTGKIMAAKNLTNAIMDSGHFCVSDNGRTIELDKNPSTKVPILDFLFAATRQSSPHEAVNPKYALFARILLDNHMPEAFLKNKSILMSAQTAGQKMNKRKKVSKTKLPKPKKLKMFDYHL